MMSAFTLLSDTTVRDELRPKILTASWLSALLWLSLGTLVIFFFQPGSWRELLSAGLSPELQLLTGLGCGLGAGTLAAVMMRLDAFQNISQDYPIVGLIKQADLKQRDIFSISVMAGISEEWLFRAALQPLLGLWISSLIFVALHGYFKFQNAAQMAFGLFMLFLSLLLGLIFEYAGLPAAMLTHAVYDIVVTRSIRMHGKNGES